MTGPNLLLDVDFERLWPGQMQRALEAPTLEQALTPVLSALMEYTGALGAAWLVCGDQGPQTQAGAPLPLPNPAAWLPLTGALGGGAGVRSWDETLGDPVVGELAHCGVRALLAAPIREAGGALSGMLVAHGPEPHAWGAQEHFVMSAVLGLMTLLCTRMQIEERERAAHEGALRALGLTLEARDAEARGHIDRVTRLAERLGAHLGLGESELRDLRWGAYLHDLGKIGLPDEILLCEGPLTGDMRRQMQEHVGVGVRLAGELPFVRQTVLDVIGAHHERWDGGGYPAGLRQEAIPLPARILSACDVFDALVSARRYKLAWAPEDALGYIREASGKHFDPQVVSALIDVLDGLEASG